MADVTGSGTAATAPSEGAGVGVRGINEVGTLIELFLPPFSASGSGSITPAITGDGTAIIAAMAAAGIGVRGVNGSGAGVLPAFVGAGSEDHGIVTGSGAAIIGAMQAAGEAYRVITPRGSPVELVLVALESDGAGSVDTAGYGSATLSAMIASGAGRRGVIGTGSASFPAMISAGSGLVVSIGGGAALLPVFVASGSGVVVPAIHGDGAVLLPVFVSAGYGVVVPLAPGSGAADLPAFTASGAGHRVIHGAGVVLLPSFTAAGRSPYQTITGIGAAELSAMLAAGVGRQSPWDGHAAPPWGQLGGWPASPNPRCSVVAGQGALTAALPNGVSLARFAWINPDTGRTDNRRRSVADVLGFVPSFGVNMRSVYVARGRWWIRAGYPVSVASNGDFWARFDGGASPGAQVYASIVDGAPVSGYAAGCEATPWYVVTSAAAGELAVISTTSRIQ